jgi:hypothetical protein
MPRLSFFFRTAMLCALFYATTLAFSTWVSHLNTLYALP